MKNQKPQILCMFVLFLLFATGCGSLVTTDAEVSTGQQPGQQQEAAESGQSFQASGDGDLSISWILSKATAQADNRALDGFKNYIKQENLNWQLNVSDAKGSPAKAADLLQNAVERGADAIILSMTDLRASKASIKSANDAGIPIFTIDSGWTEGVVVDVTSNNYVMSGQVSAYLADRLGGQGGIVVFKETTHHGVRKRGKTLDTVLSENPGIKVLAEHNIDPTNFYEDTRGAMEDFLSRYGNEIDAVWAGWDEPGQSAAEAIKAAGFSREDMFVVGIDGHPSAIEEIRSRSPFAATVAQRFEPMGALTAEYIQQIVAKGQPANEVIPSNTVNLPAPLITPENLPDEGTLPWTATGFYEAEVGDE